MQTPNRLTKYPIGHQAGFSVTFGEAGPSYLPSKHKEIQLLSSGSATKQGNAQSQIKSSLYRTLESSVANGTHTSTSFSPVTTSRSSLSQQYSRPDIIYGSHVSDSCIAEDPYDLKMKLKELESMMLGQETDIASSHQVSNGINLSMDQDRWRQLIGVPKGDLRQILIACGKAVDEDDSFTTECLISELKQLVSVSGDPIQRLGAYMMEGLIARLANSGKVIYKSLMCKEYTIAGSELLSYMHLLYEVCPYIKFGYVSANGAIAEAVKGENQVHIIDFQIAQGSQWRTLIEALAARPGNPPSVRITGIDDYNSAYARGGGLDIVGQRLARFAQSLGVQFEFNGVNLASEQVQLEHLDVRPGEALAVNFAYQLHHMPDESVSTENHRDRVLRMVKSLSPKVVTLVEQESNTNTSPFFPRFMETLDYYTAMFESIDVTLPRDSERRIKVEQHCVARDIVNMLACEGADRVERHELFGKWKLRFRMAGFSQRPLSPLVNGIIKQLLESYCENYRLEERDGALYLGWKNRALVVTSAWV